MRNMVILFGEVDEGGNSSEEVMGEILGFAGRKLCVWDMWTGDANGMRNGSA